MGMRSLPAAAVVLFLAAAPARAGLFGRSKFSSGWSVKTVDVNSDDSPWDEESAFEEDGLSVIAKNDANNLYLLVTAHTRESRDQLSGESHQDLALWFVAPDGKTRRWGARLPFSRRAPLTNALRDPAGLDPEPELVQYQGAEISSGSLPDDVADRLTAVGRRPVWELKIPLSRLEINRDGVVDMDFIINAPPGGPKRRAAPKAAARTDSPADGGADAAPARGGGRGGKHGSAESHPEDLVWDASSYTLSLRLARDPSLPR
jgi:hypothetical protein